MLGGQEFFLIAIFELVPSKEIERVEFDFESRLSSDSSRFIFSRIFASLVTSQQQIPILLMVTMVVQT